MLASREREAEAKQYNVVGALPNNDNTKENN
jgi:hypothetical protein